MLIADGFGVRGLGLVGIGSVTWDREAYLGRWPAGKYLAQGFSARKKRHRVAISSCAASHEA